MAAGVGLLELLVMQVAWILAFTTMIFIQMPGLLLVAHHHRGRLGFAAYLQAQFIVSLDLSRQLWLGVLRLSDSLTTWPGLRVESQKLKPKGAWL